MTSEAVSIDKYGLEVGTPGIKSVGPLAFGPDGLLFVGDNVGAAIFAIDVGDLLGVPMEPICSPSGLVKPRGLPSMEVPPIFTPRKATWRSTPIP